MLQYSFNLRGAHDAIVRSVGKAIADGNRTGDIFNPAEGTARKIGTRAMGDAIAANI